MGFLKRFRVLTDASKRWKLFLLLGVIVYFVTINQILHIRPDHAFIALMLLSFALGGQKAKRFLIDWLPFIVGWILYDMMRGLVDDWRGFIHIRDIYEAEFILFGKFFGNDIPSFFFQQFQYSLDNGLIKVIMDLMAANLYTLHFGLPLILGWMLWHTYSDRRMFYRYVWTLTILNIMALITFFVYPAAPPWYVLRYGFEQPVGHLYGTAGSLINIDNMINMKFFTTLWDNFNPNNFAAIPSLHGAYPIVISLFAFIKFRRHKILLILYPVLTWWAAVYLNHHYIIDLIIGGLYIIFAYWFVHAVLIPKVFDPLLFKASKKDP
ncbi:phosphatase PAP2 family protein [candidate division KSB1 bacterium]